jgi:hypothetical protein
MTRIMALPTVCVPRKIYINAIVSVDMAKKLKSAVHYYNKVNNCIINYSFYYQINNKKIYSSVCIEGQLQSKVKLGALSED